MAALPVIYVLLGVLYGSCIHPITKKTAIMMIDFALDAQRHQGMAPEQAVTLHITPVIYLALDRFSGRGPVLTAEATVATSKAA